MSTHEAAMVAEKVPYPQRPVIILGAGIIGCATAQQLLLAGFPVIVVAEFLPGDQNIFYASAWAGAAWHAAGGVSPEKRYLQASTHRHMRQMALDGPDAGICIVEAREYLEETPGPGSALWGQTVLSKFRELETGDYQPNFSAGWAYETLVTDPTIHMPYLRERITKLGGQFVRKRVESLHELYSMYPGSSIFINASGLGSKFLTDVKDEACYPERGQNVFYRTDACRTLYFRNGQEYTYIIPRPFSQGVVLGGIKQRHDVSPTVDLDIARDEIARAHRLAPHIVPKDPPEEALSYIVGIRPSRDGGFRLDSQKIDDRVVLSAYGFGGAGYAFSYGVAEALLKMVQEAERENVVGW